jgi:lipoprotein-anchoring transpeptidase ErfK/SrfK
MLKVLVGVVTAALWFAQAAHPDPAVLGSPTSPGAIVDSTSADLINSSTLTSPRHMGYSPAIAKAQVLLARAHFSPGVVDGGGGTNLRRAIAAFAQSHKLKSAGALNKSVWDALNADSALVMTTYTITAADAAGPYLAKIPTGDMEAESKLTALSFTSPREALAEKFHMTERLLGKLNPGVDFAQAGAAINVAAVEIGALPSVAKIVVNKSTNSVAAYDAQDVLVGYFPATVGSAQRPAPIGKWAVRAVAFDPAYYYDPGRLTFGAGVAIGKLKIAPGPNNPVGLVWIDLTVDTFGIHGGPEPQEIGKVSSHGCVRLTNWDAVLLAKSVKVGTSVEFIGAARA